MRCRTEPEPLLEVPQCACVLPNTPARLVGVVYHNSATDRFAALQTPAVDAASERGGGRDEFEGQIERELAEYLDGTSQGQAAASHRSISSISSPRRGKTREVTNLVKAPPAAALTKHEVTPWESWGYAREREETGGSAREGYMSILWASYFAANHFDKRV